MNKCVCVLGFVFCVDLFFQTKGQTKTTKHKPKLREEIKSSFFARISQLISNSTTKHTHTPTPIAVVLGRIRWFRKVWFFRRNVLNARTKTD